MQTSPSRAGASVPPLSLATTGSRLTTSNINIHNAATAALTGSGASPTQNKTVLRVPKAKGPGCRDWTHDFVAKRTAKKDLRERLFVVLVKRMAQLSMARLVREETSMLSTLLGRRPPPIDVKGVGGPASKPLQENSDNKCYCGRPFGFFSQHKKRCALCLDWFCDACVMQRVPLHLVNKVERALSPTDVPMLNTCEECTRIAYAYVRSVRYRAILLEGRNHPLPALYHFIMEEDQRIAHSMFGYAKMVNDLRAVDEQERARRTSLDYTSSPVVHNSVLSAAFQEALEAGQEIEQLMYSMTVRIEQLGKGIPFSGPDSMVVQEPSYLAQSPADSPRSASSSNATSPRASTLALPSGGPYTLSSRSSSTTSLDSVINVPVVEPPPKAEAQNDVPLWHPTTETDVELLGNVSTTLRDRLEEHRHFYDALHMQMMLLELRLLREVYVTVFQLSYELRELFNINGQHNEESTGVNVYLLLMQLLKVCKQELKQLVNKIEDANWTHYEEGIAGLVRKRLDNRRLIDIPPFVLRELTPDALTVLVVAKFLGIVRVEEKKLELRTAKSRFVNTKKNFRNLETIVTNTCLKQDEEERAREKSKHVSHLDEKLAKQPQPAKTAFILPPSPQHAQPQQSQPPRPQPQLKPPPQHVPPVGAGVLPLLAETTATADKQKLRERSLSLDQGHSAARPKFAGGAGSDREDGPVARPQGREKAKEAVPSAVNGNGGVLNGVMRKVGMA